MIENNEPGLLFRGIVANAETKYIRVPIRNGTLGAHIGWKNATASATITLELSSIPGLGIDDTGAAWMWKDSALTITGPAASAAGATSLHVENVRATDARLKIVGAAASPFEIWDGTHPR